MFLGQSLSISNPGQWMLSKQELLVTFSVPTTSFLVIPARETIGQRDSMLQIVIQSAYRQLY